MRLLYVFIGFLLGFITFCTVYNPEIEVNKILNIAKNSYIIGCKEEKASKNENSYIFSYQIRYCEYKATLYLETLKGVFDVGR